MIRGYQQIATGILEWPPSTFWSATPQEFFAAVDGRTAASGPKPVTAQEDAALAAAWTERQQKERVHGAT